MEVLTIQLFERLGLLLLIAFLMTRLPTFRHLLDRELSVRSVAAYACFFGLYGIAATQAGVLVSGGQIVPHIWVAQLAPGETLVGSGLVAVVIAGLLGGPYVGLGAGIITGAYAYTLGGEAVVANVLTVLLTGILAGFTARFFSHERVIAPTKALFIGMFAPILHMCLLLMFTDDPEETIKLVNAVGIPLVLTNSVGIAIFTTMIRIALGEREREAALATERALKIVEQALPHLRRGMNAQTARAIAGLLYAELHIAAVSIANKDCVLAHIGLGTEHHRPREPLLTRVAKLALQTNRVQVAYSREHIQCRYKKCPLQTAIAIPLCQSGEAIGLITLFFRRAQQIRTVEIALAQGIGKLMSDQLDVIAAEKMKQLLQEAEMRHLQAQINPHFLFNTLHLIAALIRVNPRLARHITVQLGHLMRMNLKMTDEPLIPLTQEIDHFNAYLEIVKVRFSDRLTVSFACDDGIGTALIPPFTLQPLAENSLKHGLRRTAGNGRLDIAITQRTTAIHCAISDNGCGIPEQLLAKLGQEPLQRDKGNGIGVYNVNQRLTGFFGTSAQLHFQNKPGGGCTVTFQIPLATERRDVS